MNWGELVYYTVMALLAPIGAKFFMSIISVAHSSSDPERWFREHIALFYIIIALAWVPAVDWVARNVWALY